MKKVKRVEIVIDAETAPEVLRAIQRAGQTGRIGDGKIFMMPLEGF